MVPTRCPQRKISGPQKWAPEKGESDMAFTKDRIDRHLRPKTERKPTGRSEGSFKPKKNISSEWPEVFSKKMMDRVPSNKWDRGPDKEEVTIFEDPRPELDANDNSYWWTWLLADAWQVDRALATTLHGFRCQGTMLEINPNGGMKMKPEVGEQGWDSLEDYQMARDKYLVPKKDKLSRLLRNLR
jgi:hypothetical protein